MPVNQREQQLAPPLKITALLQAKWANQVLTTAVELGLFTALKSQALSSRELAGKLGADEHACQRLCDALVAMEFLQNDADRYCLTNDAAAYLVSDSQLYLGNYLLGRALVDDAWLHLTELVKTGQPYTRVNEQGTGEEFFQTLAANIFPLSFATAQMLADSLGVARRNATVRVLDVASGSGVWSIPLAMSNGQVTVDALDFPAVVEVTRRFAGQFGVEQQYRYLPGNWRQVRLENEHYDYILLGHILHSEGKEESRRLLEHCAPALKKGGQMIVAEFLSNENRSAPLWAQLFAINMMCATSSGCVFTENELKQMLAEAGLHDVQRLTLPFWAEQSPLVAGHK